MSWLKTASIQFMYHGTSGKFLRSILSEGLNNHHKSVWDEEYSDHDRSLRSYGGVYFSDNFLTAYGSGGRANQKFEKNHHGSEGRVIVMAQLELRTPSIVLDEDRFPRPDEAFFTVMSGYARADQVFVYWVEDGYQNIERMADVYIEQFAGRILGDRQQRDQSAVDKIRSRMAYSRPLIIQVIKAYGDWRASQAKKGYLSPHLKDPADPGFQLVQNEKAMQDNFRSLNDMLMRKLNFVANEYATYEHNVRVLEPVSYRGRNKIVLVAQIFDRGPTGQLIEGKYDDDIVIRFVSDQGALGKLMDDFEMRMGEYFRVRDVNGQVYHENPRPMNDTFQSIRAIPQTAQGT